MEDKLARFPLLKVMMGNAFLLCVIYLTTGLLVETLRRIYPLRVVDNLARAMDALPARVLELMGLLPRLHDSYGYGNLADGGEQLLARVGLRVVFGLTTMAIIFVMALAVGAGMYGVRRLFERQAADS